MSRRRGERPPVGGVGAVLVLGALLAGAEAPDRVLDLAAPRPFPIEGDVPIPPPPPPPPPVPPAPEPSAEPAAAMPSPPGGEAAGPSPSPPQSGPSPSPAGAVARAAPSSPAAPTFTVQVGAFRSLEQAQALAARLAGRGYEAFVLTVDLSATGGQGVWHRVRVGHFVERHLAAELAGRLAGEERVPAQVLREGPAVR